jgi:hypothetical protein
VAEDLPVNVQPFGSTTDVPSWAIDFGNGFYIEVLNDSTQGIYYRSCSPGGAICRYSYDFWRAKTYLYHMMPPMADPKFHAPSSI